MNRTAWSAIAIAITLPCAAGATTTGVQAQEAGQGLQRCNALNLPRHAGDHGLPGVLERRAACLDELALTLESGAEQLAEAHGEQVQSLHALSESSSSLRAAAADLRSMATSPEATPKPLAESYLEVVDGILLTATVLNGVGDDAELADVDLQNELQRHQQTLRMMSNISKTLYDTALSVIRKQGG